MKRKHISFITKNIPTLTAMVWSVYNGIISILMGDIIYGYMIGFIFTIPVYSYLKWLDQQYLYTRIMLIGEYLGMDRKYYSTHPNEPDPFKKAYTDGVHQKEKTRWEVICS